MKGWLIYNREDVEKNQRYIGFYMEEGRKLGMEIQLVLLEELEFGVKDGTWFMTCNKGAVPYPDFAICRTRYPLLNRQLEYMGIRVFNNSQTAEICNDKARTYQYVAQLGIPMADSVFLPGEQVKQAMDGILKPSVMKAVAGHGGSQVFLLEPSDSQAAKKEIRDKLGASDAVLQPLTGNRHQDLRVYVIGKQIIAAILRTANEGFKSNYSLGGRVETYDLSEEEISRVNKISGSFEFGLVGIDFILGDEGELIFNEIEDVVGARMLYQCTDINLVRLYLEYICSHYF